MNASRSESNAIRSGTGLSPPLIVLLIPLSVFFVYSILSHLLQIDAPLGVHPLLVPPSAAGLAAAKIAWGISLLTYLIAIGVSGYCLAWCVVSLTGCARKTVALWITCIVASVIIGLLSWRYPNPLSIGSTDYLVRAALNRAGLWQWPHDMGANPGILCAAALIYLSVLCLWKVNVIDETLCVDDDERKAKWLARRMTILRYGLYAGALVLSAAMIWSNALHGVAAMYVPKEDAESVKQLFSSITAAQGAIWSAFLLSVYAPAALWLRSKAQTVARRRQGNPSEREWLEKHGLLWSVPQQVSSIIGSFAPLFAGLLGIPASL